MADVADLRVKYSADTSDFDRGADRVNKGISGFIKNAGAFAAGDLLAGGIRSIGNAAAGAGGALYGMAMDAADLDSKISGIVALAGGGAEDFDKLSEAINGLAINPNLIVEADEAATVMQNLIANGLTLKDVYSGAAEATVLLANATGGSFDDAATIATDTMAIFDVKAENMMTAVDGITKVTNASKLSLQDYGYALAQSGAQSAAAGVSLEDYNTGLVAINNNFSGGSDLGTASRTFFTRLIPSTADAAEAMMEVGLMSTDYAAAAERLGDVLGYDVAPNQYAVVDAFKVMSKAQGVNVNDVKQLNDAWNGFSDDFADNAFFDEEGALESSDVIAGALNAALEPLNEMERADIVNRIFGADAARAALGYAEYTAAEFRALSEEVNGLAGAQENASIRNNNLKGDMMAFGGVLDAVKLKIGKEFQPALRTLFQAGTGLLTELEPSITGIADALANGLERATPTIVSVIEGVVTAASTVAQGGFGALFANVDISTALDGLRTNLSNAFANFDLMGSIGTLKGNANGLRDSLMSNLTNTINGINWSSASLSFAGMVDSVSQRVSAIDWSSITLADVGIKLVGVLAPALTMAVKGAQWLMASDSWSGLVQSVRDSLSQIEWGDLGASFTKLGDAITSGISQIDTSGLTNLFQDTDLTGVASDVDGIGAAFGRVKAQLSAAGEIANVGGYFDRLRDSLRQLDEQGKGAFTGWELPFTDFDPAGYFDRLKANLSTLDQQGKGLGKTFNEAFTWDFAAADEGFNTYLGRVQTGFDNLKTEIGFGETTPAWLTSLQGWTWPDPTSLTAWTWPALPSWTWSAYPSWSWPSYTTWSWPAYLTFTWPSFPTFTWPSIPRPAWLDAMLSWDPSAAISAATSNATNAITNAFGFGGDTRTPGSIAPSGSNTSNNGGGYVPSGASGRGLALAGAGGGSGQTNIFNIYTNDPEAVARQVARILQQRG